MTLARVGGLAAALGAGLTAATTSAVTVAQPAPDPTPTDDVFRSEIVSPPMTIEPLPETFVATPPPPGGDGGPDPTAAPLPPTEGLVDAVQDPSFPHDPPVETDVVRPSPGGAQARAHQPTLHPLVHSPVLEHVLHHPPISDDVVHSPILEHQLHPEHTSPGTIPEHQVHPPHAGSTHDSANAGNSGNSDTGGDGD